MRYSLKRISDHEYDQILDKKGAVEAIEQSTLWDQFDQSMVGREPFGKFVFRRHEPQGSTDLALVSLTEFQGRGFIYLWGKKAPTWFCGIPAEAEESALVETLQAYLRKHARSAAFMRIHLHHRRPEAYDLLQSVTYDRTVVIDLRPEENEILANMKKSGRRAIRAAEKAAQIEVKHVPIDNTTDFAPYAEILEFASKKDGFVPLPVSSYVNMLTALEKSAKLFAAFIDGEPVAWAIVLVHKNRAEAYYGATNEAGRKIGVTAKLDWEICRQLKADGCESYDLMGIESERAPQLSGVTIYKTKFSRDITEVPGAWDVSLNPLKHFILRHLMKLKRRLGV